MSEAETRLLIDEQLRAADGKLDTLNLNYKLHSTLPEKGKNKAIAEWKCGSKGWTMPFLLAAMNSMD